MPGHASPTSTVENYLKALYVHQQDQPDALVPLGRLAQTLEVTPGTVTTMVKGLSEAGYAQYESRRGARLTPAGEKLALRVLRRHRLIELFLVEIVGYDWSEVHDDAEILEHAVSDKLLDRIDAMLGHPTADPHGDPIPEPCGTIRRQDVQPLALATPGRHEIAQVLDHSPRFLDFLRERGLVPGAAIELLDRDEVAGIVTLRVHSGEKIVVGLAAAGRILVSTPGQTTDPASQT